MGKSHISELHTPLDEDAVRSLALGSIVYLSGEVFTFRDQAHKRALGGGRLPFDLRGAVIFHTGPVMLKNGRNWKVVSVGATTSSRMNALEPEAIRRFGIRAIIGKGGMDAATAAAMKDAGCVYLQTVGGASASLTKGARKVLGVWWLDLGVPEAVWKLSVERLGPLVVTIDAKGNSLHAKVEMSAKRRLEKIFKAAANNIMCTSKAAIS